MALSSVSERDAVVERSRNELALVAGRIAEGDDPLPGGCGDELLFAVNEAIRLFDLGGLLMDLQELLGCEVDVVTEAGMRSRVSERVLCDAVDL